MGVIIRWLGNAGFELQLENTTILIDPFLTRPKWFQVFGGKVYSDQSAIRNNIFSCDHVFVSHAHFDHCMDIPFLYKMTQAMIYGSKNTCKLMQTAGVNPQDLCEVGEGSMISLGSISVSVLHAKHPFIPGYTSGSLNKKLSSPPWHLRDYRMDSCFSFLFKIGKLNFLFWNSTGNLNATRADVLTCRAVSNRNWYERLLNQVQPTLVIPQHWDSLFESLSSNPRPFFDNPLSVFPLSRIDLQKFKSKIHDINPECTVLIPKIFQPYKINISTRENRNSVQYR